MTMTDEQAAELLRDIRGDVNPDASQYDRSLADAIDHAIAALSGRGVQIRYVKQPLYVYPAPAAMDGVAGLVAKWREANANDECTLYTMGIRQGRQNCADALDAALAAMAKGA